MLEFLEKVVESVELVPVSDVHSIVNSYKGAKRDLYLQAEDKFWRDGVTKMDAMLNMFVKFEKCDLLKAPRVINPRSRVYNLALGKFLKLNEHAYFEAIAKAFDQDVVVFKGMDSETMALAMRELWDSTCDPVAIGGDATKFDMHVSAVALWFEHLFYIAPLVGNVKEAMRIYDRVIAEDRECMNAYPDEVQQLCWLLSQQLMNRGKAYFKDGTIRFRMKGTRASGDLNTSLGNCILMSSMTYAWARKSDVQVKLANNGDDCDYIMPRHCEKSWRDGIDEYFVDKGFRMVLEPTVDEFDQIEFCQSKPCNISGTWKMIRNPKTLITKATMCLLPVSNMKALRKWVMAIGVAEGSLGAGVPVIQAFARAMRRNGLRCSEKFIRKAYYQSSRIYHSNLQVKQEDITVEARLSFYSSWGITPDEQRILEDYYDQWRLGDEFGEFIPGHDVVQRVTSHVVTMPQLLNP
jgi:hypothetical protein